MTEPSGGPNIQLKLKIPGASNVATHSAAAGTKSASVMVITGSHQFVEFLVRKR